MSKFLGIDTSNYTTSCALAEDGVIIAQHKIPVSVAGGERGVRQSDAVFSHVVNIGDVLSGLEMSGKIDAVGYSAFPRDCEGSYMPCFLVGKAVAVSVASVLGVPAYPFSHQAGHVAAALYSCRRLDLLDSRFAAFHVSGGTTEVLMCDHGSIEKIGGTVDLTAGQAIDRVGVALGLHFPCGKELEKLATESGAIPKVKVCVHGLECNLSGLENKAMSLSGSGYEPGYVAAYVIEFIRATLDAICENIRADYGEIPILFAGGVMSNRLIRESLMAKYNGLFAEPEFSTDNAAGVAVLAGLKQQSIRG